MHLKQKMLGKKRDPAQKKRAIAARFPQFHPQISGA
jgi:hypothetical protein